MTTASSIRPTTRFGPSDTSRGEGRVLGLTRAGVWVLFILAAANGVFLYFAPGLADTDYAWSIKPPINAPGTEPMPPRTTMVKAMSTYTDLKVTNEERTEKGVTLTVEALDSTKAKSIGTIQVVQEAGAWKIARENWSTKG